MEGPKAQTGVIARRPTEGQDSVASMRHGGPTSPVPTANLDRSVPRSSLGIHARQVDPVVPSSSAWKGLGPFWEPILTL